MRQDCRGKKLGQRGRFDLLEQALSAHRFHCKRAGLDHVCLEAPAARLHDRTLHDIFRAAAPQPDLDAILLLERGNDGAHVVHGRRAVNRNRALFLRSRDELLHAIRAGMGRQMLCCRLSDLRSRGHTERPRGQEREHDGEYDREQRGEQLHQPHRL
jgi:hypothetical protein